MKDRANSEPVIVALDDARGELLRRLSALTHRDWQNSTPCTDWNTRQLVNHVIGVQFRVARLLAGGTQEVYVATREDDWLGRDHLTAWTQAVAELDSAIEALESLDVAVDYRVPVSARGLLRLTVLDTAVHSWDISRAIGFEEGLGDDVARFALLTMEEFIQEPALAALFSPPAGEPPAAASDQELLLYLAGRS